jgi:hypothetical protein
MNNEQWVFVRKPLVGALGAELLREKMPFGFESRRFSLSNGRYTPVLVREFGFADTALFMMSF